MAQSRAAWLQYAFRPYPVLALACAGHDINNAFIHYISPLPTSSTLKLRAVYMFAPPQIFPMHN